MSTSDATNDATAEVADDQVERLAAFLAKDAFTYAQTFRLTSAGGGRITGTASPGAEHANAGGFVHGGYLAAFADWATGTAALSAGDLSAMPPHASLSVQFISFATPGEELRCEALCHRFGRRAATTETSIFSGERLIARAIATHTVVPFPEGAGS